MKKLLLCLSLAAISTGLITLKPANASAMTGDERNHPDCKSYFMVKVQGKPDWTAIPELSADTILWEPDCGIRAFGQFCYDDGNLYVHLRAVEKEIGHNRSDRFALYRGDIQDRFDIRTARTEDGWEVYYQIPLEYIRLFYPEFDFSGALRANIYKCGDQTVNKHYLSWNPIDSEKPDFHRPEDFGIMYYAE